MICPFCQNTLVNIGYCSTCSNAKHPGVTRVQIYSRWRDIFLENSYAIALDTVENKTLIEADES
jgi:transcription elongation factor Elf1